MIATICFKCWHFGLRTSANVSIARYEVIAGATSDALVAVKKSRPVGDKYRRGDR